MSSFVQAMAELIKEDENITILLRKNKDGSLTLSITPQITLEHAKPEDKQIKPLTIKGTVEEMTDEAVMATIKSFQPDLDSFRSNITDVLADLKAKEAEARKRGKKTSPTKAKTVAQVKKDEAEKAKGPALPLDGGSPACTDGKACAAKEPPEIWKMSQEELMKGVMNGDFKSVPGMEALVLAPGVNFVSMGKKKECIELHRQHIKKAIDEGKNVPEAVRTEYEDTENNAA
jgi:PRTRC genetic system protein E